VIEKDEVMRLTLQKHIDKSGLSYYRASKAINIALPSLLNFLYRKNAPTALLLCRVEIYLKQEGLEL